MNSGFSDSYIVQAAIKKEVCPKIRFCSIFLLMLEDGELSLKDIITAMQKRINIPNDYKNLVLLLENLYPMLFSSDGHEKTEFSAEQYLNIIEKLDALRNPSNLDEVLEVIALKKNYSNIETTVSLIRKSLVLAQSVKINNLQEDGLEGSVIGQKLRELRLNKIKEKLKLPK